MQWQLGVERAYIDTPLPLEVIELRLGPLARRRAVVRASAHESGGGAAGPHEPEDLRGSHGRCRLTCKLGGW